MTKKSLIVLSALSGPVQPSRLQDPTPRKNFSERYFHAITLNDMSTLSTMALEPMTMEVDSWKVTKVSEEKIEPAKLPDLNAQEMELQKEDGSATSSRS